MQGEREGKIETGALLVAALSSTMKAKNKEEF